MNLCGGKMYTIITSDDCPWCDRAKGYLKLRGKQYVEYNIKSKSSAWILYLLKRSSITKVPQIFDEEGQYVGSCEELEGHK